MTARCEAPRLDATPEQSRHLPVCLPVHHLSLSPPRHIAMKFPAPTDENRCRDLCFDCRTISLWFYIFDGKFIWHKRCRMRSKSLSSTRRCASGGPSRPPVPGLCRGRRPSSPVGACCAGGLAIAASGAESGEGGWPGGRGRRTHSSTVRCGPGNALAEGGRRDDGSHGPRAHILGGSGCGETVCRGTPSNVTVARTFKANLWLRSIPETGP